MSPSNDNDARRFVWFQGRRIYAIGENEKVAYIGIDKLIVADPSRPPRLVSAIDGAFLGEIRL